MKQNRTFIFIMLLLIVLSLSACSSQTKELSGKYIDVNDEKHYLIFNKDGSFIDNYLTTTSHGNTNISDGYTYQVDDSGFITIIDTTEYEFQDSLDKYELGWLYNDNIGIWLDGSLPVDNAETFITVSLNGYDFKFHFNTDGTYTLLSNDDITNSGTYTVNDNKVVCTSEDGAKTTFISAENKVFCVEYVKE